MISAADPLNLVGVLVPGERVPAIPGREVQFRNGALLEQDVNGPELLAKVIEPRSRKPQRSIADLLRGEAGALRPSAVPNQSPGLFP